MDLLIFHNVNSLDFYNVDSSFVDSQCLFYFRNEKSDEITTLNGTTRKLIDRINGFLDSGNIRLVIFKRDNQVFPFSYNERGFFFSLTFFYSFVTPNAIGDIIVSNLSYEKDSDGVITNTFGLQIVSVINEFLSGHNITEEKELFTNCKLIKELEETLYKNLNVPFLNKLGLKITKIVINEKKLDSDKPGWGISDLII